MYRVKLLFLHDPAKYTDERQKCLMALFYFTDDAFAWGQPYAQELSDESGDLWDLMAQFLKFESVFLKQFSSISDEQTAKFELESFKQTKTVAEYAAKFRALANQTE